MDRHPQKASAIILGLVFGALVAAAERAYADLAISQIPLFLGVKAQPNVIYDIDDSWSMVWRYMPDSFYTEDNETIYGNPWATGNGDAGDSGGARWALSFHPGDPSPCALTDRGTNNYPDCGKYDFSKRTYVFPTRAKGGDGTDKDQATDLLSARLRSPTFNSIYYNPEVRYEPWYKSDGTKFPNADIEKAWLDGNLRTDTVNLKGEITFDKTWVCTSLASQTPNDPSPSNGTTPNCQEISGETIAPATYYIYTGPDLTKENLNTASNFTRVRIMDHQTFTRGSKRTDCSITGSVATCTQTQEYQNFANWFTYNRNRMSLAIAAASRAFAEQGQGTLRVGFARIKEETVSSPPNIDGVANTRMVQGVRPFMGAARTDFFDWLYSTHWKYYHGGTPLPAAIDAVGQYFQRKDDRGPWATDPSDTTASASNENKNHISCRKCYHILMTDGAWTKAITMSNEDNTAGSTITGSDNQSYTYAPIAPYKDSYEKTLADVAMYYWKNDLRPDLANNIVKDEDNPAFWQNMVNFTVGLGVNGSLQATNERTKSDLKELIAETKSWPNPTSGNAYKVDDLWHAALNSRGRHFSAGNPQEFADALSDVLNAVAAREGSSSSSIAANSTRLDTGTIIYQASFNSADWSGRVIAYKPYSDGKITNASGSKNIAWDTNTSGLIPAYDARNIFTAKGTLGTTTTTALDFNASGWDKLTSEQQTYLTMTVGTTTHTANTINWLRGKNDITGLRVRNQLLGDIVNSDPFFVGDSENHRYNRLSGTEGSSYTTFLTTSYTSTTTNGKSGRPPILYIGANDGMLHGFNAKTGAEVFAYLPLGVYPNLTRLPKTDYKNENHRYYVDGSPRAGDAYIGGAWKTILVGSTGAGGRSVFALDVTNPSAMGPNKFLWEFSTSSTATDKLGIAMSQPTIARLSTGDWVAIFGNGYESGDTVKLLVVKLSDGSLIQAVDTKVSGTNNGLAPPIPVDINDDRITDFVYAGDLAGNLWKFDLSNSDKTKWSASTLFVATDSYNKTAQPITSRPVVGEHPDGGVMVYFGSGKFFETGDATVATKPQIQSFYGIRDRNTTTTTTVSRQDLASQSILYETTYKNGTTETNVRVVSNNAKDTDGWYLDMLSPSLTQDTGAGERVVSAPLLRYGRVVFTSIIPDADPCAYGGTSWLMEVDAITGGRQTESIFDMNDDGLINDQDFVEVTIDQKKVKLPVSGIGHDEMTKTPAIVGAGEVEYKYTSGSAGTVGVIREKGAGVMGRQGWRQLR